MSLNVVCPLCGSAQHNVRKKSVRYAKDVDVHDCQSCQFVYLWPQPSDERLNEFYTNEYRNVYDDPTPEERHADDTAEAQSRVERLTSLFSKNSRVLEIGSGSCAFLKNIALNVGDVVGVEMDKSSREWFSTISDIPVHHTLDEVSSLQGFDLIVSFHVLEHLSDPVSFLKSLAERLNEGGHIVIEVPNVNDALISLYKIKEFEEFYFSIAHLTYFAPLTLNKCAQFASLSGEVTGLQRYDLSNHIYWTLNKRPGGQGVFTSTLSDATQLQYKLDLKKSEQTDTLWGVFKKKSIGSE